MEIIQGEVPCLIGREAMVNIGLIIHVERKEILFKKNTECKGKMQSGR